MSNAVYIAIDQGGHATRATVPAALDCVRGLGAGVRAARQETVG